MTMKSLELYMRLSSYAPWGSSPQYPRAFLECVGRDPFRPDRMDERDPSRRRFSGTEDDVRFWLDRKPKHWGRWLFFKRSRRPTTYSLVVHWYDREQEFIRSGGDYHSLVGSVRTNNLIGVLSIWRCLCETMRPFHALLDTMDQYNRRANRVQPDGSVEKLCTSYDHRLPGLFAYNFFGRVYASHWGEQLVAGLPVGVVTGADDGFYLTSPSGLDATGDRRGEYTDAEMQVIRRIGETKFHLPGRPDGVVDAPPVQSFVAAAQRPDSEG